MTENNISRRDFFYKKFNIKSDEDKLLFPEDIENNVVFNTQNDLIDFMKSDEEMLKAYRKVLNHDWQEVDGMLALV